MPSHSVNPSPLQPAPAVTASVGRDAAVPAVSHDTASLEDRPAAAAAAADPDNRRHDDDDDDLPTQMPEETESDATQRADLTEEPQPGEPHAAKAAEPLPQGSDRAAGPDAEPAASEGASPAAPADDGVNGGGPTAAMVSPFAAAKAAAIGRGSAAAQRAQRRVSVDPYAFPETQDMVDPHPAPWTRKRGAKVEKSPPPAPLLAVPESDNTPSTSHERTPPAPGADAAAAAAAEPEGPAEADVPALGHAKSPDQQSQHVPKARAQRVAAAPRTSAEVSARCQPAHKPIWIPCTCYCSVYSKLQT